MAVGVYRIDVGSDWTGAGQSAPLVPHVGPAVGFPSPHRSFARPGPAERTRIRGNAARTRSHRPDPSPSRNPASEPIDIANARAGAEIDIARTGIRRRIPLLGVTELPIPLDTHVNPPTMDRVVALDKDKIASAIQELAEQAAAERRKMTDNLFDRPNAAIEKSTSSAGKDKAMQSADSPRALPIAEIIAAFEELKSEKSAHKSPR